MNGSALAIAATTATLRGVLDRGIGDVTVTVRPLDTARENTAGNQVNLFLYQALPDAAWRNRDIPGRVLPGETAQPPLPLTLYYLITTYGDEDNDLRSHLLLGQAMSVLHDYPLLGMDEIKNATDGEADLKDKANLHEQLERIRITLQPLTFEEISKLWTTFQTHYRTSAAYQVSVVLIESMQAMRAALPVLRRGEEDRGPQVEARLLPEIGEIRIPIVSPFESLDSVRLAKTLPSAVLDDEVAILGHNFPDGARVRLKHLLVEEPFERIPTQMNDETIVFRLPDAAAASATWPAGFYTTSIKATRPDGHDEFSNELVLSLAPAITIAPTAAPAGDIALTVTTTPSIGKGQRVSLLFNNEQIQHDAIAAPTNTLSFDLKAVAKGDYVVRIRVDGVDSIALDRTSVTPKFFDGVTLKVT
jgi:hypothetical protein